MSSFDIGESENEGTLDIGELMRKGWQMRDLPWMIIKYYDGIMSAFGKDEVIVLAGSRMLRGPEGEKEMCCRAQIIVSPKGFENLIAWNESGGIDKLG